MADFNKFNAFDDTEKRIRDALAYCKENGERELIFPKDTYRIKRDYAYERFLSISNHSHGLKRIAFLLEGFRDFTIDLSGSTLILEDVLIPFALIDCENVHLKNFKVKSLKPMATYGVLTDVWDDGFSAKITGSPVYVENGYLVGGEKESDNDKLNWINEWRKKDGMMTEKYSDLWPGQFTFRLKEGTEDEIEAVGGRSGLSEKMVKGNYISIQQCKRTVCGIFIDGSKDSKITDYTIYNGIGMGVIAQNADGVKIEKMTVRPDEGSPFSINADATHFVHCRGLIHVSDSHFEGQLDDALNVHGIYLRVEAKTENSVILRFMHPEALGIDVIKKGSVLEACDPESLIPDKRYTVSSAELLNIDRIEVTLEEGIEDIKIGDDMNEVSYVCDVLFENNTVRNNRARGMLLASAGKTVVKNNTFETPGAAIKFESNGEYWFESGGTRDVLITQNKFVNALYVEGGWGSAAVIDVAPRKKLEEGKYYHGKIEISDNLFKNIEKPIAKINNTEHLIMKNNTLEDCATAEIITEHIGKKELL